MRAIAGEPELEVVFHRPAGPLRNLGPAARAAAQDHGARHRGDPRPFGDSMALRIACHDKGVHAKNMPQGPDARAIFDAVEQARCEAVGARRMQGVGRQPCRHARRPLPEVRRAGHLQPRGSAAAGRAGADGARTADRRETAGKRGEAGRLWRAGSRTRPGRISTAGGRGRGPAGLRRPPRDAEIPWTWPTSSVTTTRTSTRTRARTTATTTTPKPATTARKTVASRRPRPRKWNSPAREQDSGETEAADGRNGGFRRPGQRPRRRKSPAKASVGRAPSPTGPKIDYKVFTTEFDEDGLRRGALRRGGAGPAARLPRQAAAHLQGAVARLANRLQRRLMAQQNRAWDFDLEEGLLDSRRG
jgi:cobaltochelatase CobT